MLNLTSIMNLFRYIGRGLIAVFLAFLCYALFVGMIYAVPPPTGTLSFSGGSSCTANPTCGGSINWTASGAVFSVTVDQTVNGNSTNIYTGSNAGPDTAPVIISQGSNHFVLNINGGVTERTVDITGNVVTPTPNPTAKTCDQDCSGGAACVTGLACINNKCRLPAYPNESSCNPPSYPEYRSCNQSCTGGNQQCVSGLNCISGVCRLSSNPNDTNCNAPAGNSSNPTATPTKVPTGGTTLGVKTTVTPVPTGDMTSPSPSPSDTNVLSAEATPTEAPTATPTPAATVAQAVKDHPIMAAIVGVIVLGSAAFLIKFRKDLAVF